MREETFTDMTEILISRGEKIRRGARMIVASGGEYKDNRRYYGYPAGWNTLKLYPADRYTYSVVARSFLISRELIELRMPDTKKAVDPTEAARRAAADEARRLKEERRQAIARAAAKQIGIFGGGTANEGA